MACYLRGYISSRLRRRQWPHLLHLTSRQPLLRVDLEVRHHLGEGQPAGQTPGGRQRSRCAVSPIERRRTSSTPALKASSIEARGVTGAGSDASDHCAAPGSGIPTVDVPGRAPRPSAATARRAAR